MEISFLLSVFMMTLLHTASSTKHVVYWDQDLIPKLTSGGLEINLEVDDYMDVLCPYANQHHRESRGSKKKITYLRLFNVTRSQYNSCDTRRGIMLQTCDDPYSEKKLTTKFQEHSPYPLGFTFIPGATYYYLSKPLEDYSIGCTKDTMRMMIHVHKKGTVFTGVDHRTRTYHLINRKEPTKHEKTADHAKGRRHHHEKSSPSTTRQTFIIQYETHPPNANPPRASQVRNTGPGGNSATNLTPSRSFSLWFSSIAYIFYVKHFCK